MSVVLLTAKPRRIGPEAVEDRFARRHIPLIAVTIHAALPATASSTGWLPDSSPRFGRRRLGDVDPLADTENGIRQRCPIFLPDRRRGEQRLPRQDIAIFQEQRVAISGRAAPARHRRKTSRAAPSGGRTAETGTFVSTTILWSMTWRHIRHHKAAQPAVETGVHCAPGCSAPPKQTCSGHRGGPCGAGPAGDGNRRAGSPPASAPAVRGIVRSPGAGREPARGRQTARALPEAGYSPACAFRPRRYHGVRFENCGQQWSGHTVRGLHCSLIAAVVASVLYFGVCGECLRRSRPA